MSKPDLLAFYKDITPDMADDWRQIIMPYVPQNFAIGFETLTDKVYGGIEKAVYDGVHPASLPTGKITNAILAMEMEGELTIGDTTVRRGAIT